MFERNNRGFTLVELLVVIAIIGLLAIIVVVSLNVTKAKSRDGQRIADIKNIKTALEFYNNEHSRSLTLASYVLHRVSTLWCDPSPF